MGNNFVVCRDIDFIDYTIHSKSSELGDFPALRVKEPEKRDEVWQTSDTNDNWIILDFGAPRTVNAVCLINTNYTTCKIQGNSTTDFSSPAYDSGLLSIVREDITGNHRLFINPQEIASFNYRYMRIFIPAQTPVDGGDGFRTGGIIVTHQAEELLTNPSYGFSVRADYSKTEQEMLSGRIERIFWRKNPRRAGCELIFEISRQVSSELDQLLKIFNHTGNILIYFRTLGEFPSGSACFLMFMRSSTEYRIESYGVSVMQFSLVEKI
jgi:hypothetical protein